MFSIDGIDVPMPKRGNSFEDTTQIIIQQTEDDSVHTQIKDGEIIRQMQCEVPNDVYDQIKTKRGTEVALIFDDYSENVTMMFDASPNFQRTLWNVSFTFYEKYSS
ncbi:MAG: hypothetical protein CL489_06160 [Acidobacteria bacterium]|nr:hypothetical protein [Acidobacteriota bacterium]|tara:strand:+ start:23741 stop:24058 length:318 start_codon:yes stop_codon:yes gene_type:complete